MGDAPDAVRGESPRLCERLALPEEPYGSTQVHGGAVADPDGEGPVAPSPPARWGGHARAPRVCAIQVADCLPVFLASAGRRRRRGGACRLARAGGWSFGGHGSRTGATRNGTPRLARARDRRRTFEVGAEVRAAFLGAPRSGRRRRSARERARPLAMRSHRAGAPAIARARGARGVRAGTGAPTRIGARSLLVPARRAAAVAWRHSSGRAEPPRFRPQIAC